MPAPRRAERWLVVGTSESGKSYWAKRFVDALPRDQPVIIWDPENEWAGPDADGGISGALCFNGVGAFADWFCKHNPNLTGKRIVIQGGEEAQFAELAEIVYRAGYCWFIVDEAHDWCEAKVMPKVIKRLVRRCRHRRVNFMFVSQRAAGLDPTIRAVKSRLVLFQSTDQATCDWVRKEVCKPLGERLSTLTPRSYCTWVGGNTWQETSPKQRSSRSPRSGERSAPSSSLSRAADSSPTSPTSTRRNSSRRS